VIGASTKCAEDIGLPTDVAKAYRGTVTPLVMKHPCGTATENLICTFENGEVTLYFVPRDRTLCAAAGLSGCPGGLEVFGQFVLSAPAEWELIKKNRVDFAFLRAALESILPVNGLGRFIAAKDAG
jgi:hypothetical protein